MGYTQNGEGGDVRDCDDTFETLFVGRVVIEITAGWEVAVQMARRRETNLWDTRRMERVEILHVEYEGGGIQYGILFIFGLFYV